MAGYASGMIKIACLLLSVLSLFSASKLPCLYNCWQFEGTLSGISAQPFQIVSPAYEPGLFGSGLRCNATADASGPAIGTVTMVYTQDWTGMVWLKANTITPTSQTVLDNVTGSGINRRGISLQIQNVGVPGVLMFTMYGAGAAYNVYSAPIATSTTNCILFGFNAATQQSFIRVNDVQVDHVTPMQPGGGPPANIRVGSASFDGVVDLLALWKGRVLSATEMGELYNGGLGVNYPFP